MFTELNNIDAVLHQISQEPWDTFAVSTLPTLTDRAIEATGVTDASECRRSVQVLLSPGGAEHWRRMSPTRRRRELSDAQKLVWQALDEARTAFRDGPPVFLSQ